MTECRFCAGSGCSTCSNSGREGQKYQVGALLDFRGSDIEVDGLQAAHQEAGELMAADWCAPVGIWTEQAADSVLVEIWYQGCQFRA